MDKFLTENWLSILVYAITLAIAFGAYKSIITRLKEDVTQHTKDIAYLKDWVEECVKERDAYNENHYVRIESHDELDRRITCLEQLDVSAQLAEIKAMLLGIKERLDKRG